MKDIKWIEFDDADEASNRSTHVMRVPGGMLVRTSLHDSGEAEATVALAMVFVPCCESDYDLLINYGCVDNPS